MKREDSRLWLKVIALFSLTLAVIVPAFAETDPDPNSPTPVILSIEDSTRALATPSGKFGRTNLGKIEPQAFRPDSKVVIYVVNIELLKGESANAFRVYSQSADGRVYRYPVSEVRESDVYPGIFAVTFLLKDEFGFWQPPDAGDVLISLAWRGLSSNKVKLGYGERGGKIDDSILCIIA